MDETIWSTVTRTVSAVVLVGALAAAASACGGQSDSTSSPTDSSVPADSATQPPVSPGQHRRGAVGAIAAINGTTWTVQTPHGETLTVTVTPQTQYGSRTQPSTAGAFAVGQTVVVIGPRTGNAITATRITTPRPGARISTAPATP